MEKLLVAIDGSAPSERAADHAIRLSAKYGMPVHFVTVFPEPLVYGEVEIYMTKDKAKKIQTDRGLEFLRPPLERARAAGVEPTSEVVFGDIAPTIVETGKAHGCAAIIIGTRGMGAIGNLLMGSVASKVVYLSDLPVTLIK